MARPLQQSSSIWSDLVNYFLHAPQIDTLIEYSDQEERRLFKKNIAALGCRGHGI